MMVYDYGYELKNDVSKLEEVLLDHLKVVDVMY